jgi:hypothetical protein
MGIWSWIFIGMILMAVVGLIALFRSFRRWQQPPPGRDPESQQAEARLWSKMPGESR